MNDVKKLEKKLGFIKQKEGAFDRKSPGRTRKIPYFEQDSKSVDKPKKDASMLSQMLNNYWSPTNEENPLELYG